MLSLLKLIKFLFSSKTFFDSLEDSAFDFNQIDDELWDKTKRVSSSERYY